MESQSNNINQDSQNNNINTAILNAFNNPILINSLSQSIMRNINLSGPFKAENLNKNEGLYESYKTTLRSKHRLKQKKMCIEFDDEINESLINVYFALLIEIKN